MNTVTLHFKADNQQLTALDGLYKLASNTVEYVKAIFTLGENWTGFDVVRAAWYTDFECISTVLDGNGECFVPWEVLSRPEGVTINLYGCDLEEESDGEAVLVDRLTTYPVKAILVDVDARVCGSETKPVTPSQFEQYIAIVEQIVGTVKDIDHTELTDDYCLIIYYSDGTNSGKLGPIRGEHGPTGPAGNGISKIEKISTAGLVDTYRITFTNGTHKDYTVTNGAKGDTGNGIESIYLTGTSGAVKTYTILFTNGNTFEYQVTDGEVTRAELEAVLPTDTASGSIASFPDGSDLFDYLSCVVEINPVQAGSGTPSPQNVRPITGWTGCEVDVSGVNLFDKTAVSVDKVLDTTTGLEVLSYGYVVTDFIPVATGQTVFIPASGTTRRWFYDSSKNPKTFLNESGNQAFTPTEDGYIRVSINTLQYSIDAYQIEVGSTATPYKPYSATTYPVSWQTEAGTVYGGTVDLVSGVLTVTHSLLDMSSGSFAWSYDGVRWQSVLSGLKNYPSRSDDLNFERYGVSTSASSSTEGMGFTVGGAIYIYTSNGTDAPSGNIWYPLATPTTYQLTPTQIHALLGQNNVWADCGDTSVTYKADVQRWVEKKLGA